MALPKSGRCIHFAESCLESLRSQDFYRNARDSHKIRIVIRSLRVENSVSSYLIINFVIFANKAFIVFYKRF